LSDGTSFFSPFFLSPLSMLLSEEALSVGLCAILSLSFWDLKRSDRWGRATRNTAAATAATQPSMSTLRFQPPPLFRSERMGDAGARSTSSSNEKDDTAAGLGMGATLIAVGGRGVGVDGATG